MRSMGKREHRGTLGDKLKIKKKGGKYIVINGIKVGLFFLKMKASAQ